MEVATTVDAVREWVRVWKTAGLRVGFVPTMGNLHEGHLSLLSKAREHADRVIASSFVNPLQFGPQEDYSRYPRTPEDDRALLSAAKCDLLFAPTVDQIYPAGGSQATLVTVRGLSEILCGVVRPGHFAGVATVVAKLFGIVAPHVAVFGEKDYQQFLVIQRMTLDLAIPVEVIGAATVRAHDGLALSSRNRYLSPEERARAPAIYQSLAHAVERLREGERDFAAIETEGLQALKSSGMPPDYFSVRNATSLDAPTATDKLVVLTAARLGRARLIDNIRV
jgi:pantoate--beta-alanine ligase